MIAFQKCFFTINYQIVIDLFIINLIEIIALAIIKTTKF